MKEDYNEVINELVQQNTRITKNENKNEKT
jgi:hypothetical protein